MRLTSGGLASVRERIVTTNCKKSAEAIVPTRGRAEQFVVAETTKKWDSRQSECVNEQGSGVTARVTLKTDGSGIHGQGG